MFMDERPINEQIASWQEQHGGEHDQRYWEAYQQGHPQQLYTVEQVLRYCFASQQNNYNNPAWNPVIQLLLVERQRLLDADA